MAGGKAAEVREANSMRSFGRLQRSQTRYVDQTSPKQWLPQAGWNSPNHYFKLHVSVRFRPAGSNRASATTETHTPDAQAPGVFCIWSSIREWRPNPRAKWRRSRRV